VFFKRLYDLINKSPLAVRVFIFTLAMVSPIYITIALWIEDWKEVKGFYKDISEAFEKGELP